MPAYLLLVVAVLSRVVPHAALPNFTAVGGSLLYFGARRKWREMVVPMAVLVAADFYLTMFVYHYGFRWQDYLPTWAWYAAAMVLGRILLRRRTSLPRFATAVILGPTSFFLITNFAAWLGNIARYPQNFGGLMMSYAEGIPFYRNDLVSTTIFAGLAFGVPVLVRRMRASRLAQTA
jgi:hypothetical protein